jgi:ribosome-associated heat shock protein Hsp15
MEARGMDPPPPARVDSWAWAVRLFNTPSHATAAIRAGHVRVNGERAKSAQSVRVGDEVRVRSAGFDRIVVVSRVVTKRVGATVAAECFVDNTPPPPPREEVPLVPVRDRGAGRPTKRERRDIEKLRGQGHAR